MSIVGWPEGPTRGILFGMFDDWEERQRNAFDIIGEVQPQYFGVPGVLAFAFNPPAFAGAGGGAAPVQYVVQHPDYDSLAVAMDRFSTAARQIPGLMNVDTDFRVTKPELTVAFDRDRAEDLGVSVQEAAGTLQGLLSDLETATFTQNNELYDIVTQLEREDRSTPLDISNLYVRGRDGGLVQMSSFATVTEGVGPRQLNHFNRTRSFTLSASVAPGVTLGEALERLDSTAAKVLPEGSSTALAGESRELRESGGALYVAFGLALLVVYMVLASQFGSLIHPFTVLLAVPLAVTGALLALWALGSTINLYSQVGMILLIGLAAKNSILLVEYINQLREEGAELVEAILEAGRIRLRPILMTTVAATIGALPIALGLGAGSMSRRPLGYAVVGGLIFSALFTLYLVPVVYELLEKARSGVRRTFSKSAPALKPSTVLRSLFLLMLILLPALALAAGAAAQQTAARTVPVTVTPDTLPTVTLEEALARASEVDPALVAARGQVGIAAREERAARSALFTPALSAGFDATDFSDPAFNPGTLTPGTRIVTAQLQASYEVFGGGRRLAELRRARASGGLAEAEALRTRFGSALATTEDFYAVVAARDLRRVAADRVRRAEEQLEITRARVVTGAAVHTDSLQAFLELTRARTELLEQDAALRVARLQLGRQIGVARPVGAAVADTTPPAALPLSVEQAMAQALKGGPEYLAARADERATDASVAAERSAYYPRVMLYGAAGGYDSQFFPDAQYRSQIGIGVNIPIWDQGARGVNVARARAARETARATRSDLERGAARGGDGGVRGVHHRARHPGPGHRLGWRLARETFRVQQVRYRSGATTILDVLEAQVALTRAEADRVQARQRARLRLGRAGSHSRPSTLFQ